MGAETLVIAYGCCVGSWDRFNRYVQPCLTDKGCFAISGAKSIATAYNSILTSCLPLELEALILVHDDLEIIDPEAEAKFLEVLKDPEVALVGVAGARGVGSMAWWNAETVGHQAIETGLIDFGVRTGDVDALEGSILVFSPWAIRFLRFDPLPGFHGYDVLISRKARSYNKRVVVADVDTLHHTVLGFKSKDSESEWQAAEHYYQTKWGPK